MSSSSSSSTSDIQQYEELKENLNCPICLERFSKPVKILSCLHSFCQICLESLSSSSSSSNLENSSSSSSNESNKSLKCPICRRETKIEKDIKEIENNEIIHSMIDSFLFLDSKLDNQRFFCDCCENENINRDSIFRCIDCHQNLCEDHQKLHSKSDFEKNHKIINLKSNQIQIKDFSSSFIYCFDHPDYQKNQFCIDCNKLICQVCVSENHQNHQIDLNENIINDKKSKIQNLIEKVQPKETQIFSNLKEIKDLKSKIEKEVKDQTQIINQTFDEIHKIVEERKSNLINELKKVSDQKLEELSKQEKQIEVDLDCVIGSIKISESMIRNGSNYQILDQYSRISNHFFQLSKIPDLQNKEKNHEIKF